jgi:hypothetical protein
MAAKRHLEQREVALGYRQPVAHLGEPDSIQLPPVPSQPPDVPPKASV